MIVFGYHTCFEINATLSSLIQFGAESGSQLVFLITSLHISVREFRHLGQQFWTQLIPGAFQFLISFALCRTSPTLLSIYLCFVTSFLLSNSAFSKPTSPLCFILSPNIIPKNVINYLAGELVMVSVSYPMRFEYISFCL